MHHGSLYAIALGWPTTGELRIRSLARGLAYLKEPVCGVSLLGSTEAISFRQEDDGLHIVLPKESPDEPAFTFRILEQQGKIRPLRKLECQCHARGPRSHDGLSAVINWQRGVSCAGVDND